MARYVVLSTTSKKVKVGDSLAPGKKIEPVVVEEPPKKKVAKKKKTKWGLS